jgi:hypothetical protein
VGEGEVEVGVVGALLQPRAKSSIIADKTYTGECKNDTFFIYLSSAKRELGIRSEKRLPGINSWITLFY